MSSFKFKEVYIKDYETIIGPLEKEGFLNCQNFLEDYYYGEKTFEDAEIKMQNFCLNNILRRNKLNNKVELLVGGDLSNQLAISSYNVKNQEIPFLGVYNACATFNEIILILANLIEGHRIDGGLGLTSSHNLNAEKQFRYPIEYGAIKKKYSTFTTTGAACCYLTNKETNIKVESGTIGTVVDLGIKDVSNMGAVMAPSAAKTLHDHLTDLKRDINYYDIIVTGDLGEVGANLFLEIIKDDYNYIPKEYMDAATIIYRPNQQTFSGGSGPVVIPLVLFNELLRKYKKILLLATGSLHNPVMVNEKKSIPSITHAISIEVLIWYI